ncbi:deoxyribonuclease I [Agarivorans sp. Toyoura001]|uniref:endonuclease n=1 Tax=Agarivorans sp. Toyoura001 TaxID=2283141 RepID=UPI0010E3E039|nr:endonuclease [Agarivorans sp. Toyoura001]GDY28267.1 deoxyribonuclease I [Agarivorans sp. Toyoura001]
MKFMFSVLLMLFSASSFSQTVIQTYDEARVKYFWNSLYKDGGQTIYCGQDFTDRAGLNIEHIYPASWIAEHFGCYNRDSCPVDAYHFASADLHNLWPSRADINKSRSNHPFGSLPKDTHRVKTDVCDDYEKVGGLVEPRDSVKGDIARTIFYMHLAYGLPLKIDRKKLTQWHDSDPVDQHELDRNKAITKIQKRGNPFICYEDCNGPKPRAIEPR